MSIHKAMHLTGVERREHDLYQTPVEVTRALLSVEGRRLSQFPEVWEPASGEGHMVDVLRAEGLPVVASDIVDRGMSGVVVRSFYDFDAFSRLGSCVVTNPPFKECNSLGAYRWLKHARALCLDYMALLLPSQWPYAKGLRPIFQGWPPSIEYKLSWRIDWGKGGSSPANHSWFCWSGHQSKPRYWATTCLYRDEIELQKPLFHGGVPLNT